MAESESIYACAAQVLRLGPDLNRWAAARLSRDCEVADLSLRQLTALYLIREESGTLGQLARRMMVTPAVVTGIVDRLERHGYVRRVEDAVDRRRVQLELTEAGLAASVSVEESLTSEIAQHIAKLPEQQRQCLQEGLGVLLKVFNSLNLPVRSAASPADGVRVSELAAKPQAAHS